MFEITATTRRAGGLPGTDTKVAPYAGEFIHDRTTAELAVSELNGGAGRPGFTYAMRKVYLPACDEHHEAEGDCGSCEDYVQLWLQELRDLSQRGLVPPAAQAAWQTELDYADAARRWPPKPVAAEAV